MQNKIIVLASWGQIRNSLLLQLANYVLAQQLKGNDVTCHWFLSDTNAVKLIADFVKHNQLEIKIHVQTIGWLEDEQNNESTSYEEGGYHEVQPKQITQAEEEWLEVIPTYIEEYIKGNHGSALEIIPPTALDELPIWFFGITDCSILTFIENNDLLDAYDALLPFECSTKASALLCYLFDQDCDEEEAWAEINNYKIQLLCFTKLLFEVASTSEGSVNEFQAYEAGSVLDIDYLYVGGLLTKEEFSDLQTIDGYDENINEIALSRVLTARMDRLINRLKASHGENYLFAIFWWCFNPDYSKPFSDKFDDLMNDADMYDEETNRKLLVYDSLCTGWKQEQVDYSRPIWVCKALSLATQRLLAIQATTAPTTIDLLKQYLVDKLERLMEQQGQEAIHLGAVPEAESEAALERSLRDKAKAMMETTAMEELIYQMSQPLQLQKLSPTSPLYSQIKQQNLDSLMMDWADSLTE